MAKVKTKKKDKKGKDIPYVSCKEVTQYLTELSTVLGQISDGIKDSIITMEERVKGDDTNGK